MKKKMNVLSVDFIDSLKDAYSFVECNTSGAASLITASALPKVFSAGLDLKIVKRSLEDPERKLLFKKYK